MPPPSSTSDRYRKKVYTRGPHSACSGLGVRFGVRARARVGVGVGISRVGVRGVEVRVRVRDRVRARVRVRVRVRVSLRGTCQRHVSE